MCFRRFSTFGGGHVVQPGHRQLLDVGCYYIRLLYRFYMVLIKSLCRDLFGAGKRLISQGLLSGLISRDRLWVTTTWFAQGCVLAFKLGLYRDLYGPGHLNEADW